MASDDLEDLEYEGLQARVNQALVSLASETQVFLTTGDGLFDLFLDQLPLVLRASYDCSACRRFVDQYGGLVTIDKSGETQPLIWDNPNDSGILSAAVSALHRQIKSLPVKTVFKTSESLLGRRSPAGWTHLNLQVPKNSAAHHPIGELTAARRCSELTEHHKKLNRALQRFTPAHAQVAAGLLRDNSFMRASHIVPQAQWFWALYQNTASVPGNNRTNRIWSAVATAPHGWANVRSGPLGPVLDDIQYGKSTHQIAASFKQ